MKILGLPGVVPATRKWMHELFLALAGNSREFSIHEYRHWLDDSAADIDYEASCLNETGVDLVIAKSLGTFIATHAFEACHFRPRGAVFIGSPLSRHGSDNYELLSKFATAAPTLFIQQTSDFNGSYSELSEVVQTYPQANIVEVPGDDHIYGDIDELRRIIHPCFSNGA